MGSNASSSITVPTRFTSTIRRGSAIVGDRPGGVRQRTEDAELADAIDQGGDGIRIADVARNPDGPLDVRFAEVDGEEMIHRAAQPIDTCSPHAARRARHHAHAHVDSLVEDGQRNE